MRLPSASLFVPPVRIPRALTNLFSRLSLASACVFGRWKPLTFSQGSGAFKRRDTHAHAKRALAPVPRLRQSHLLPSARGAAQRQVRPLGLTRKAAAFHTEDLN